MPHGIRRSFLLKPVAAAPAPPPAATVSSPTVRRPYVIRVRGSRPLLADNDFAENGSIYRHYQMQYWAPAVLYKQFSCPCGSCSSSVSGSCSGPVFSEGSSENGIEDAL